LTFNYIRGVRQIFPTITSFPNFVVLIDILLVVKKVFQPASFLVSEPKGHLGFIPLALLFRGAGTPIWYFLNLPAPRAGPCLNGPKGQASLYSQKKIYLSNEFFLV